MNSHHTKLKGDIAVAMAIADLTQRGYFIFTPLSENSRYDLVADTGDGLARIQVKYRASPTIPSRTTWQGPGGTTITPYSEDDFDYFAIYRPSISTVIYPSIKFMGLNIRASLPAQKNWCYWYEDFLCLTDSAEKRLLSPDSCLTEENAPAKPAANILRVSRPKEPNTCVDCLKFIGPTSTRCLSCAARASSTSKIDWPDMESLKELVWSKPRSVLAVELGVSDVAISKRCKKLGIEQPSRGYWSKTRG